jgi:hypothetical protein
MRRICVLAALLLSFCHSFAQTADPYENEPYYCALKYFIRWQKTEGSTAYQKKATNALNFNLGYNPLIYTFTGAFTNGEAKIDSFMVRCLKDPIQNYASLKSILQIYKTSTKDSLFDVFAVNDPMAYKNNVLTYSFNRVTYRVVDGQAEYIDTDWQWVTMTLAYNHEKNRYDLKGIEVSH